RSLPAATVAPQDAGQAPAKLVPGGPAPIVQGPAQPCVVAGSQSVCRPSSQDCSQRFHECFGYPSEFRAAPLGHAFFQNFQVEVVNAEVARMILYHFDFTDGSPALNTRGKAQLFKIVDLMPTNFAPLVIEATPDTSGLDEARRLTVVEMLAGARFP